jgi:pimeloyl-ACP methyl ester carboxylesterase
MVIVLAGTSATVTLLTPAPASATPPMHLTIGDLRLTRCAVLDGTTFRSWCGTLDRPLDGSGTTIPIRFALALPRDARPGSAKLAEILQRPLIAAFEGGPGYGGIDSGYAYADMLGPLMTERGLLVMDARGTGRSSAIDCPALQKGTLAFLKAAAACAQRLGLTVDDYGTAMAADDAAAIIRALGFGQADIYGDSYGTYLAQVLAGRHPTVVRSMVLDGAYPVTGEDAWYPTQAPALRAAWTEVCSADPSCRSRPGDTATRITRLLERLRKEPITVVAPGGDGKRHRVRIGPSDILDVAFHGTDVDTTYQELDPAVRAALVGNSLPLGRLVAEFQYPGGTQETPRENSSGQFMAVTCQDYPQLFDITKPRAMRRAQLDAAIARARDSSPDLFAPFTVDDYVDSSWETIHDCLSWAQLPADRSGPPGPPSGSYPDVPVLVLSGTLDTITTAAEGRMVAAQFPRSRAVDVPFGLHVQAMGDAIPCAASMTRAFFVHPDGFLAQATPTCLAPRPRMVPTFARNSESVGTARAVVLTVADAVSRMLESDGDQGVGLRGGSWELTGDDSDSLTISMRGLRLFADLPVSGTATWRFEDAAVTTDVTIPGGRLTAWWNDTAQFARISGSRHGSTLPSRVPAP